VIRAQQIIDTAIAVHNRGDFPTAERLYREILAKDANHFAAGYMLGALLLQKGAVREAATLLSRCRDLGPPNPKLLSNLGLALTKLKRTDEAIAAFDQAIALEPGHVTARLNRANALRQAGKLQEALAGYDAALAYGADADVLFNRGSVLEALERPREAMASYLAALDVRPDFADAHTNLGNLFKTMGDNNAALAHYDRVLELRPDFAEGHINRAAALFHLRRHDEARRALAAAIAINPAIPEAWANRGNIAREEGRFAAALEDYAHALSLRPNDVQARWNRGLTWLLLGQWPQGWADYELRAGRRHDELLNNCQAIPEWAGEDLRGRRILLYNEQGLGDCIQFSRFCGQLAGAEVTLLAPRCLQSLLSQLPGVEVVTTLPPDRHFDFCGPLMSLPRFLDFTPQTVPAGLPALTAPRDRKEAWRTRLGEGFKVGICWQGNPQGSIDVGRSIPLRHFAPLAEIDGVRLISLQKGKGLEQLADLPAVESFADMDAGEDGFLDSAAIIANCDLVVTSDTSIAHLAGAMGVPVWTVLKYVPDWRWLTGRCDTPWYPTMRLYRQARLDDWDEVFGRVAAALAERCRSGRLAR
jgi:tetratricopeptide (TPR) repeat protein